jgi:hypothetical protein
LAVCGLPRPAANLDQFDQSKEFERVGSDVSSCRGRRPQKVLAYLFDLKAGCLEVTIQVPAGTVGFQGLPVMASRSAVRTLMPCLRAVEM